MQYEKCFTKTHGDFMHRNKACQHYILVFGNISPASTLVFAPASNVCYNTELVIVVPEM